MWDKWHEKERKERNRTHVYPMYPYTVLTLFRDVQRTTQTTRLARFKPYRSRQIVSGIWCIETGNEVGSGEITKGKQQVVGKSGIHISQYACRCCQVLQRKELTNKGDQNDIIADKHRHNGYLPPSSTQSSKKFYDSQSYHDELRKQC